VVTKNEVRRAEVRVRAGDVLLEVVLERQREAALELVGPGGRAAAQLG
jgi:hypothetical protein